jgi:hypothetical protein
MIRKVVAPIAGSGTRALKLDRNYAHMDIGSPERCWEALDLSYRHFCRGLSS